MAQHLRRQPYIQRESHNDKEYLNLGCDVEEFNDDLHDKCANIVEALGVGAKPTGQPKHRVGQKEDPDEHLALSQRFKVSFNCRAFLDLVKDVTRS